VDVTDDEQDRKTESDGDGATIDEGVCGRSLKCRIYFAEQGNAVLCCAGQVTIKSDKALMLIAGKSSRGHMFDVEESGEGADDADDS